MAGNLTPIVDLKDMINSLTEDLVRSHRDSETLLQAVDEFRNRIAAVLQFQRISLQLLPWLAGLQEDLTKNAGSALAVMTSEDDIIYVTSRSEDFDKMGLSVLNALAKAGESNAAVMELCIGHILKPLREATGRMSMSLEEISRLFFKNEEVISQLRAASQAVREVEHRLETSRNSSSSNRSSNSSNSISISSSGSGALRHSGVRIREGEREAVLAPMIHVGSLSSTCDGTTSSSNSGSSSNSSRNSNLKISSLHNLAVNDASATIAPTPAPAPSASSSSSLVSSARTERGSLRGEEQDLDEDDFIDAQPVRRRHTTFTTFAAPVLTTIISVDGREHSAGEISDDDLTGKTSTEYVAGKRRRPFRRSDGNDGLARSVKPRSEHLEISD